VKRLPSDSRAVVVAEDALAPEVTMRLQLCQEDSRQRDLPRPAARPPLHFLPVSVSHLSLDGPRVKREYRGRRGTLILAEGAPISPKGARLCSPS
jgi:hypothetical protein